MSTQRSFSVILGNQLFPYSEAKKHIQRNIFMAETHDLATHFKYHYSKILYFFSSMREYKKELEKNKHKVEYHQITKKKTNFITLLESYIKINSFNEVFLFEVEDHFFEEKLTKLFNKHKIQVNYISSPMFLTTRKEFKEYLDSVKKPFMKTFYEAQRKRMGILMEGEKPKGGKWSFDDDNRKKLPKAHVPPEVIKFKLPEEYKQLDKDIKNIFKNHPGTTDNFIFPLNTKDAKKNLHDFFEHRFNLFGDYEDALHSDHEFNYHSLLSPSMNIGHLPPKLILKELDKFLKKKNIALNSHEGFIRQIIGWREFIRGIYHEFDSTQQKTNFFNHKRGLTKSWYTGETGIEPVDNIIQKINKNGYAHHIERLMVLSNIMLLCEIHPKQVYKWFMEMFVDSSDWVMGPNVYGMGQFSDGGIFATKPYICGSNYILKMSNYKKGPWTDVVDGLYWSFIEKNKKFFQSNYRMSMMVKMAEKMPDEKRNKIYTAKNKFLKSNTTKEFL